MVLNQGLGEGFDGDAGFDVGAETDEGTVASLADEWFVEIDGVRVKARQQDISRANAEDAIGFHANADARGFDDEFAFLAPGGDCAERRAGLFGEDGARAVMSKHPRCSAMKE